MICSFRQILFVFRLSYKADKYRSLFCFLYHLWVTFVNLVFLTLLPRWLIVAYEQKISWFRVLAAAERLFPAIRWPHAGSELLTLGALYEFFGRLFEGELYSESREESVSLRRKMDVLKPVLEYIDANYASPITLSDLSRLAGMSSKYFCRFFRAALHRTPVDYLNYYRIERACHILTTTELPVTEVAYRCGFNDSSYFVKTFRKYMGITPRAYAHRR